VIDDERGRGTGPDGHPLHVDGQPPEAGQVEVLADLCHQADTAVKQRGGGEGHGETGSAGVSGGAVGRPVGSRADVADEDQINRCRRPVPMGRLSWALFLVQHLPCYPARGRQPMFSAS